MDKTNYKPINCDFYDHFEIYAMRKQMVTITYNTDSGNSEKIITLIKTLQTRNKIEYLITLGGMEIRLDQVTQLKPN